MTSYKSHFQKALAAQGDWLHLAAHSHHLWPDVTRAAQIACWDDAAKRADAKWARVFGEVVPRAQQHVARLLNLPEPRQIVFGPNTHDFVARLFTCLPLDRPARVLTTDGEFHSFTRQAQRLAEAGCIELHALPVEPFDTLEERMIARLRQQRFDFVFFSHVLFETGRVLSRFAEIVATVREADTLIAIDGYHGFAALPTDLAPIADRVFYLAGGYKYAMAGENACFLAVPGGCALRPRDTGWFASFDKLGAKQDKVRYSDDGFRFAGATFDPVGLYRFNAAWDLWQSLDVEVALIHQHAASLQQQLLDALDDLDHPQLRREALVPAAQRGHFLAFDLETAEAANELTRVLETQHVRIDCRGRFVRFGLGLYHDSDDIVHLAERIARTVIGVTS